MLKYQLTKKQLADLAWSLYSSDSGTPYIISLMTTCDLNSREGSAPINENEVVEPELFFRRLDILLENKSRHPSNMVNIVTAMIHFLDLDINQTPRYINDPILKEFVIWRLKHRI